MIGRSRALVFAVACVGLTAAPPAAAAPDPGWEAFLSRDEIGASAWTRAHPTWDGRGVVIAVLDTGVDPSVPGLDRLPPDHPSKGPKLIETRDFSGQGHVAMARAERDGEVWRQGQIVVRGVAALPVKPLREGDYWLGAFDEKALQNGQVEDIDQNGRRDDRFAVLAFRRAPDGDEVAVVDTDGDGDLADEQVRRAYAAEPTWFAFGAARDPRANKPQVAVTVTPALDDKRVELHFDDGSHGSHCAGIAAGFGIQGKPGFDGIAPGAELMSLKIGHNALSGGATTRGAMADAIRFASRWAREHRRPVVINMSYGVGSELEGAGEVQKVLDDELQANRWLAASLSAGNQGPGLSSVGNPSGTVLGWTAGALVPDGAWGALFGAKRPKSKRLFAFSSRGGELDKPDGVAPGVAWSTVPPFLPKAVKNGTSMASPQCAGAFALLISGALADGRAWTPGSVKRALREGARPVPGYSRLDQGAGLIDIGRAWEIMKKAAGQTDVAGWQVSTAIPGRPGMRAATSFWRVGGYAPERWERLSFRVEPRFYGDVGAAAIGDHMDAFRLDADVGWLTLDRNTVAIRGASATEIQVGLDREALTKPGLHVGSVRASLDGVAAFELPVAVVVPERFRETWSRSFAGKLDAGDVTRIFVEVPPGATSMQLGLTIPGGAYGNVWLAPFTPEGHAHEAYEERASSVDRLSGALEIAGADLAPGTWEVTLAAPLQNRGTSRFELTIDFVALDAPDALALSTTTGGDVEGTVALVNGMADPFRGDVAATIDAFEREREITVKGDRTRIPIEIGPGARGVDVELSVTPELWNRFTDIAVNLLDANGHAVEQTAFGERLARLSFEGGPGSYTLEVVGGLTTREDKRDWKLGMIERHRLAAPIAMRVSSPAGTPLTLYPGVRTELSLSGAAPTQVPDGFHHRATIVLTDRDGSRWARLVLPITR